jgi:hypothetical protein
MDLHLFGEQRIEIEDDQYNQSSHEIQQISFDLFQPKNQHEHRFNNPFNQLLDTESSMTVHQNNEIDPFNQLLQPTRLMAVQQNNEIDPFHHFLEPSNSINIQNNNDEDLANQFSQPTSSNNMRNNNEFNIENDSIANMKKVCTVCASKTNVGLYYNAITCEACKKFFYRCSDNYQESKCISKTDKCLITFNNRTCIPCRLKKCLDAGMDIKSMS